MGQRDTRDARMCTPRVGLGTGATAREKRWSTIICTERGWTEFNPSVNGLGFINQRRDRDLPGATDASGTVVLPGIGMHISALLEDESGLSPSMDPNLSVWSEIY